MLEQEHQNYQGIVVREQKIIITSAGKNRAGVEVAGPLPLLQGGKSKIVKIARIRFAGTEAFTRA